MKVWTERIEGIGANGEENEQTVKASYTAYLIDNNPEEAEKSEKRSSSVQVADIVSSPRVRQSRLRLSISQWDTMRLCCLIV